jgi:hypothetical protein
MTAAPADPAAWVPFSLSPAQISTEIINYSTSDRMKLCKKVTNPQKTEYDGLSEKDFVSY